MKLVVDAETDTVLGASMCGPDAPEIIQVSTFTIPLLLFFQSLGSFSQILHFWFLVTELRCDPQGIAVALKCGATKASFDSTVCLFKEAPCSKSSCPYLAVNGVSAGFSGRNSPFGCRRVCDHADLDQAREPDVQAKDEFVSNIGVLGTTHVVCTQTVSILVILRHSNWNTIL